MVVLAGYQTVKEALVQHADVFGLREPVLITQESNKGHGKDTQETPLWVWTSSGPPSSIRRMGQEVGFWGSTCGGLLGQELGFSLRRSPAYQRAVQNWSVNWFNH